MIGKSLKTMPEQIGATGLNTGTLGLTVIVSSVSEAHCPSSGVNTYVVVAVLSKAGDHVPLMPFNEEIGKSFKVSPGHIGVIPVNVGVIL